MASWREQAGEGSWVWADCVCPLLFLPTTALAETSPEGHCFATGLCQLRAGSANASAGSLEECCAQPWGQSWQDGRSQACLSCSSHQLPGGSSDLSLRDRHGPGHPLLPPQTLSLRVLELWASLELMPCPLLSDEAPPTPAHQRDLHCPPASDFEEPSIPPPPPSPSFLLRDWVGVSPPGTVPSPALLQPLAGAVAQLWSQRQRPSATCATWSGFHYRTFDRRHYHFLGRCTYLLAGAADSTWAVHLEPRGHCPQPGHCQLVRREMGTDAGRELMQEEESH